MGSKSNDYCYYKKRRGHRETQRRPCEDGSRNWSAASTGQGIPRITSSHPKVGARRGKVPRQSLQKEPPCQHLDFRLLASWTVRQYSSAVLSHLVCGDLLWQQQETHTPSFFKEVRVVFVLDLLSAEASAACCSHSCRPRADISWSSLIYS